ncbi:MAG: MFS transporter [Candidatus Brocadiia bacterium]|jgi:FSR family fosmidomycin resistance protein-like MFS transporter
MSLYGVLAAETTLLMLVHFFGDFYGAFYYPLVPYFREHFGLTLTAIGALAAVLTSCGSYFQPVAWMVEDRLGARRAMIAAICAAVIGAGLLAFAWNLASLAAALLLCGLGVGLFHPIGAALSGRSGARSRVAAIGFYMFGGSIGVMLAPLLVPRAAAADIRWVAALAVPGLIFAGVLCLRLRPASEPPRVKARAGQIGQVFRRLWPIHLDVVLRFIPLTAYVLWLPVLATLRGQSKAEVGQSLAFMMLVGAAGVLAGGYIGVRLTGRWVVVLSEVAAAGALALAPRTGGALFYALLGVGSFLLYMVTPIQIAVAQRLAPEADSAASGIVMGFAYGNAGLMMLPLGRLGDYWKAATGDELLSVQRVLQLSACFLIPAVAATLMVRSAPAESETSGAKG